MSTNTQPRQPSGTPTGGQFTGKTNPESDIELPHFGIAPMVAAASHTTTADFGRLRQVTLARADLEVEERNLSLSLIAAAVIDEYPSATQYVLHSEPDDMGGWYPDSIAVFDGSTELGVHEFFGDDANDLGYRVWNLSTSAWPDCTEDDEESLVVDIAAATPTRGHPTG